MSCAPDVLLEAADERLQPAHGAGLHAVADARAVDLAPDQAGILQHLQVLRDGGLREGQLVHDVAADAGFATHQQPHDLDARRVTEGLRENREILVGFRPFHGAHVRSTAHRGGGVAVLLEQRGHDSSLYDGAADDATARGRSPGARSIADAASWCDNGTHARLSRHRLYAIRDSPVEPGGTPDAPPHHRHRRFTARLLHDTEG